MGVKSVYNQWAVIVLKFTYEIRNFSGLQLILHLEHTIFARNEQIRRLELGKTFCLIHNIMSVNCFS